MANVVINDSNLTAIGNAIREKNGTETKYKPKEMAAAIQALDVNSGGSDLETDFSLRLLSGTLTTEEAQKLIDDSIGKQYTTSGSSMVYTLNNIRYYSFYYQEEIKSINIPVGCTRIYDGAFMRCYGLESVKFPEGLLSIGTQAFSDCSSLKEIELPSSLTNLGSQAFWGCAKLTKVTFKGTPQSITSYSFYSCSALTDIYVPWAEGAVADAPWGANNATIHYNSTV